VKKEAKNGLLDLVLVICAAALVMGMGFLLGRMTQ
jgi:hypothetical protein